MRNTGLAIVAAMVIATPARAEADQTFSGAGQRTALDCDGGSLRIEGASNEVSISGGCTALEVEGASNTIQVDMAPGGTITLVGASNRVRWTAPKDARVKVQATGAGNRVLRAD